MAMYRYKALTDEGSISVGFVDATSDDHAIRLLKEKHLFVVSLSAAKESLFSDIFARIKKVGSGDIANFTRQMATMIVAGLTLPESLAILRAQTTNKVFAKVLSDIEHQIVSGGNFADALAQYPEYFSSIYVSLVRAGESSGLLDKILVRLADTLEQEREFKAKIVGAMIYPVIIVVGMIAVVTIMMVVVMPKLTDLYKDFNISLPVTTQLLITMSNFTIHFWWLMILLVAGAIFGFRKWHQTAIGEVVTDSFILKIPIFGELQKKIILVDFTRTLSMLITSGIHILDALRILKGSLGNVLFRNDIEDIMKKVEKGFPLGETFAQYKEFPIIVSQMIKVGEETGKIDDTLLKLSIYFQSESESMVRGLTSAIEPIIMVVLGVGVGFIVISIITPIYNLTAQFK